MYRFFVILFLIITKSMCAPLLAEEPHTPQKNQETFIAAELNHTFPDLKNMHKPTPPPQSQKEVPLPSPKPKVRGEPPKEPAAERDNREILKNVRNTYTASVKELSWLTSYVGFGILIAIFAMDATFRVQRRSLVLFSSSLAILSLLFNYSGCAYLLKKSENILRDANQNALVSKYLEMWEWSDFLYWTVHVLLFGAVIFFGVLGYQYFFYVKPCVESNGKKKRIKSQ